MTTVWFISFAHLFWNVIGKYRLLAIYLTDFFSFLFFVIKNRHAWREDVQLILFVFL